MWLYNSSFEYVDDNDDGAGSLNFRMAITLDAGSVYYLIVRHHYAGVGAFSLNSYSDADVSYGSYYLKNEGSSRYMDIEGPSAQEWVQQNSFHDGSYAQWTIQKQSDGYYTIRSLYGGKYYVGISEVSVNVNNIKLYSGISDSTKWKLYQNNAGSMVVEPKNATGKVLYIPNLLNGTQLQLSALGASVSNRNLWNIAYVGAFLGYYVPSKSFNLQCATNTVNNSEWYPLIVDSVNAWNNSSVDTDITLTTSSSAYTIEVGSYADSWYGATWMNEISGTSLTEADITINTRTLSSDSNVRRSTITHEIGHLLGLNDNPPVSRNESLMMHSRDRTVVFIPQEFDIHNVKFLYD